MRFALQAFLVAWLGSNAGPALATTYDFSTLAGTASAAIRSVDATGSAAQFYSPRGVAVGTGGNLYVADSSNHSIRQVTPGAVVTTFAGTGGIQGQVDATGASARFIDPWGIAADGSGNLYVADTSGHRIRKITAAGVVTTLAGSPTLGSADGTGTAARFFEPRGLAVDAAGNVFVADFGNHTVRKITPAGVVTTLAGTAGSAGNADGIGAAARFRGLAGIAVDSTGVVYVADTDNHTVRRITAAGEVTTLAGSPGARGSANGTGNAARFSEPRAIAVDASGMLFVSDYSGNTIRRVTSSGVVTTLAGSPGQAGTADGTGSAARFFHPSGLAVDASGTVFVMDTGNNTLRRIDPAGAVTTVAGLAGRSSSVDGTGGAARFEDPYAITADAAGTVYVADATDHSVRRITPAGVVTTLAGMPGSYGSTDGTGSAARFMSPLGIAVDGAGTVYVADAGNYTVRRITAAGDVTTLAGLAGQPGAANGTGSAARFSLLNGIAVDAAGSVVYVADSETIRRITAAGVVTTLAGTLGANGFVDGTGAAARFQAPFALAVDTAGNVIVCDHGNSAIRRITPAGVVTTLAGSGSLGNADGIGSGASFRLPSGVAVDATGAVFVADTDNQTLRRVDVDGTVTTVGGLAGTRGSTNGAGTAARFFNPKGVALDAAGTLYVADRGNFLVRKGAALAASALSASPASLAFGGQSMNTTSPALAVTLTNGGGSAETVATVVASTHFAATHDCGTVAAGASCTALVTFTPASQGSLTGTLTLITGTGALTVPLSGTGERSLTTHYYRAILRRAPDAGGQSFWESEANRMQALGVNRNETWYSMAGAFYGSAEYLAFGRDDTGFVTDLYNTFFNRPPDAGGLAFWTGQLAAGMPRDVVLVGFMFSTEFVTFTQAIFGTTTVRREIDTIVDFYRGILARLPDSAGFSFWVAQFRAAQCQGASAVTAQGESISSQFALSAEYAARSRSDAQYVSDLYNAFLRRSGELSGVQFWINQIATSAQSREQVRRQFVASPEFSARVQAVIAQGCL